MATRAAWTPPLCPVHSGKDSSPPVILHGISRCREWRDGWTSEAENEMHFFPEILMTLYANVHCLIVKSMYCLLDLALACLAPVCSESERSRCCNRSTFSCLRIPPEFYTPAWGFWRRFDNAALIKACTFFFFKLQLLTLTEINWKVILSPNIICLSNIL